MMAMRPLDLDTVVTFALVADLKSFTRAAEATATTQSAVSLKLKRLEERLGRRLLERTPRSVRLTADGQSFLDCARELIVAHDRAVSSSKEPPPRLAIGISDHVAGSELASLLARVAAFDPTLVLEVTIGFSHALLDAFDRGVLDAVVVRREGNRRDGERLLTDEFAWFAAPEFRLRAGEPLRLASLAAPCGVRALAIRALDRAGTKWVETFVGGGVAALAAAVAAGLGVAAFARRVAPPGAIDIGATLRLPRLGRSSVVLQSRVTDARPRAALRTLAAAFRATSTGST
jgi:DNA-binding transcriptional LysR family regulator